MKISKEKLFQESRNTGFRPEVLEKVFQLLNLLEKFNSHPYLKGKWALKGGTALNLFQFYMPRLSVDIDLNYIGALDRDVMLGQRPKIEQAIEAVCLREGMNVVRKPTDHAGGKWQLRYASALTQSGNLEVDLNFMYRQPLWPIVNQSALIGTSSAHQIPVLDLHELAAGKLAALFSRHASRDLFDAHHLLTHANLDQKKLRLGFVLYGAMNRKDWREVTIEDIGYKQNELEKQLAPVVTTKHLDVKKTSNWAKHMIDECRQSLEVVFPLNNKENLFLNKILDDGKIIPELITSDKAMIENIKAHPLLQWKAQNVRRYKGE